MIRARDLIKQSVHLYRDNFSLFIRYAILLYLPFFIGGILATVVSTGAIITTIVTRNQSWLVLMFLLFIVLLAAISLISLWFSIAFMRVIAGRIRNAAVGTMREQLRDVRPLIGLAILITVLGGLATLAGLFFLIIPGIVIAIWLMFGLLALTLDDKQGTAALAYSAQLEKGRWWAVLWRVASVLLIYGALTLLINRIFINPLFFLAQHSGDISFRIIVQLTALLLQTIFSVLTTPFLPCAQVILYEDLKHS